MSTRTLAAAAAALAALAAGLTFADPPSDKETTMTHAASGRFDVDVKPLDQEELPGGNSLGRFSLDKHYHGDLEATGKGSMLTAGTPVEGSAGYVAMEGVEGTLGGRRGSFVLQHTGTMGRGEQQLEITVLRDSGTGELEGLEGRFGITITDDGDHLYELEYTLPEAE